MAKSLSHSAILLLLLSVGSFLKQAKAATPFDELTELRPLRPVEGTPMAYAHGRYYIRSFTSYSRLYHSTNGVNWNHIAIPGPSLISRDTIFQTVGENVFTGFKNGEAQWVEPDFNVRSLGKIANARITGAAFGNNVFVATTGLDTSGNNFIKSGDGMNWTPGAAGPQVDLTSITFAEGKFVATAADGKVAVTPDAVQWETYISGASSLSDIEFGKGRFVAVGGGGAIVTSENAIDWTPRQSGTTSAVTHIAFGNGKFLTAGAGRTTYLMSDEGATWTRMSVPTNGPGGEAFVNFGGDLFYLRMFFAGFSYTTQNGVEWNTLESPGLTGFNNVAAVDAKNGILVAMSHRCFYTTNGLDWVEPAAVLPFSFEEVKDITHTDEFFYAVGDGGIMRASHPTNWVRLAIGRRSAIAIGNGMIVTVGDIYTRYSTDGGSEWKFGSNASEILKGVAFGNGVFVAVGENGLTLASANAVGWTPKVVGPEHLNSIIFANSRFVACGSDGAIYSSATGLSWTKRESGTTNTLRRVKYAKKLFVAVGDQTILTSPDAITWTGSTGGTADTWLGAGELGDRIILTGAWGVIARSGYFGPADLAASTNRTGLEFLVKGQLGSSPKLQATTSLDIPAWQDIAPVVITNSPQRIVPPTDSSPQKFFRLVQ